MSIRVALSAENGFRLSDEAILLCVERGMMLAPPLPKGEHLIEFGGVLPDLIQAVTYRITVE